MAYSETESSFDSADDVYFVGGRKHNTCSPCSRTNKTTTATIICRKCDEKLCKECCKNHKIYTPGKHEFVEIEPGKSRDTIIDMEGFDKCLEHGDLIVFQCLRHDGFLGCDRCRLKRCKGCNILKISELAEGHRHGISAMLEKDILKCFSMVIDITSDSATKHANNESEVEQICDQIEQQKNVVVKLFDNAKKRVHKDLSDRCKKEKQRLDERNATAMNIKSELEVFRVVNTLVQKQGTYVNKCLMSLIGQNKKRHAMEIISDILRNNRTVRRVLVWDQQVLNVLCMKELQVTIVEELAHDGDTTRSSSTSNKMSPIAEVGGRRTIKRTTKLKTNELVTQSVGLEMVRSQFLEKTEGDDKLPSVSGLDFLHGDRIVIADAYNMAIFILDSSLQRKGEYRFKQANPYDVTSYKSDRKRLLLAVTLNNCSIALMSVDQQSNISSVCTVTTTVQYFSIARFEDDNFVVGALNDKRHARILDVDGHEQDFEEMNFPCKKYKPGESKCTYIRSSNTVVVTDVNDNSLNIYDIPARRRISIKDEKTQRPSDVCACPDGTLFITSLGTNTLIQMSSQGKFLKSLSVDMENPFAVGVSQDGRKVALANDIVGEKTVLKVFLIKNV